VAAVCIQRLWRGAVDRAKADRYGRISGATMTSVANHPLFSCVIRWEWGGGRLYINKQAVIIQRLSRRFLAHEYYMRRRREAVQGATTIQRAFRGWFSRKTRNR